MVSSSELQNAYVSMYTQLRNYIWGFETVEDLAELEIAIYSSFPDMNQVNRRFNSLYIDVKPMFEDDEELKESVEKFKSLIESIEDKDDFYFKLGQVTEVM